MFTGGWVIHHLIKVLGWGQIRSYRVIFFLYAGLGIVKLVLALCLSNKVESEKKQEEARLRNGNGETAPLLNNDDASTPKSKTGLRALLPDISRESVMVVMNLCILFALDSFASALASM